MRITQANKVKRVNLQQNMNAMDNVSGPLRDQLVGYYKLEDPLATIGVDLTDEGCTYPSGKVANGAAFDGNAVLILDSDVTIYGFGTIPSGSPPFTISLWVKPNASSHTASIVELHNTDTVSDDGEYYLRFVAGKVRFGTPGGGQGNGYIESAGAVAGGSWVHVVFGMRETGIFLYVNNGLQGEAQLITNGPTINPFTLGSGMGTAFTGMIDELGIWSRALNEDEIELLYNAGSGLTFPF